MCMMRRMSLNVYTLCCFVEKLLLTTFSVNSFGFNATLLIAQPFNMSGYHFSFSTQIRIFSEFEIWQYLVVIVMPKYTLLFCPGGCWPNAFEAGDKYQQEEVVH